MPAAARTGPSMDACASLAQIALPSARIVASEAVAAGTFKTAPSPIAPDLGTRIATMPAFCRVQAIATPTPDSRIGIEVWLPLEHWNGRLLGTGNGGGAGRIAYEMGMVEGIKRGFAVTNTDMGTAPDINAVDTGSTGYHGERAIDFGHRATHEMTRVARALVAGFYKVRAFHSYFEGCSTGGQQALSEAQRYPGDYDGILAGDPGNNRTHVATYFLWNYAALTLSPAASLSAGQWAMVTRSVLSHCAGTDGGAPGDLFLTDPRLCRFDPATLPTCASAQAGDSCLTAPQLATLRRLYAGPVDPRTGERIYAGLTPGSEDKPLGPLLQGNAAIWPDQQFYPFRWALGGGFSPAGFDFDRDLDRVDASLAGTLNANAADLSDFAGRGGKMMIYTGLADPAVPFAEVVAYYDRAEKSAGGADAAARFLRLFLVPGMGHCFGGPGATSFGQPFTSDLPRSVDGDALMTLVAWTERGVAPDTLIARAEADKNQPPRNGRFALIRHCPNIAAETLASARVSPVSHTHEAPTSRPQRAISTERRDRPKSGR